MKNRWNWSLWVGFLLVLAGFLSYPVFARFPITRDLPWANLLLLCAGLVLLGIGVARVFRQSRMYRGKIFGSVLTLLSLLIVGLFAYGVLYQLRQVPASSGAPRIGQKAPEFTLPDQNDKQVSLAELLASPASSVASGKASAVLVIFYRGFW
jgi:hypothetical protein